ncbi:hypothetical protein C8A01DRAFT_37695 [Parachaetomium inaequale]|uniref:C2H2-type domain-containing protein n=1 Tax=Parachaetomium inaequale TaxID=2588326 RepID=A0AAN6PH12_9PEZI|nr:hypothetical protein C8A01DRAFT_37695 [Parachaetomium inaequale]
MSQPGPHPLSNPSSQPEPGYPPQNSLDDDDHEEDGTALDLDSDSDHLHETRPNRWRGHPSTWQSWTERDRRTWLALENVRKEDLGVHLYNAFGLRRGLRGGPDVGLLQDGGEGWEPGKAWTAWPVKADEVPDDGLLPRTGDVNEPFTFRREEGRPFAGCNLEEEISAAMLRRAKEKFWGRGLQGGGQQAKGDEVVLQSIEKGDVAATTEGETDASDVAETTGRDDEPRKTPRRKRRAASPTFTPVVSADDERSYALLRPAARGIMARLDDTLMILHNQRMAGLGNMSESSASDEEETDVEGVSERPSRAPSKSPTPRYRGGRPKKVQLPRDGETEQEMLVRLARAGKRKLPTFSGAESGEDRSRSRSRGRRPAPNSGASSRASSRSERGSSVSSETNREKLLARWGLRGWRDVLGAAALAGFSPAVMARATQRCATLFREEMTMHTLHEQPAASDNAGLETVRYVPGDPLPSSSEDDDSDEELVQLRAISRQSSVKPGMSSPEPESEMPARRRSRSGTPALLLCPHQGCRRSVVRFTKRSNFLRHLKEIHGDRTPDPAEPAYTEAEEPSRRSRSGTPGPAHLCPYPSCPRAVEGFTKRTNLARHLQTVHGKRAAAFTDDEEDSADEMDGGVHVDRFLQPIKMRKGWRGDDTQRRPPRSRKKARAGSEELDSFL